MISTSEIVNYQRYGEYVRLARPIVDSYGGQYLLQSDKVIASKDWQTKKIVIIKFSSKEQLDQCFQSDEYKAIIALRERSIVSRFVMVES